LLFPPRLDRSGASPPVGPLQYSRRSPPGQGHPCARSHPHGCRRCLLKGCERWFRPSRPQARYCSPACQRAARRWRRWRAAQRYRASEHGKQRRRVQSQCYRQRQRRRHALTVSDAARPEGQRPATIPQDFSGCPCDRPGCYQLFVPSPRSPDQHFCSPACRQALRRVRQRDGRRLERRRRGSRPRRFHARPPP
jgi:hypothetical protein